MRTTRARPQEKHSGLPAANASCANDYWLKISQRIQADTDQGNKHQTSHGAVHREECPLKTKPGENITDKKKQMEQWVEHYLELYSTQNVVTGAAFPASRSRQTGRGANKKGTRQGHRLSLAVGKAPGKDGLSPEREFRTTTHAWHQDSDSTQTKATVATATATRAFPLLSILGKVFAIIILARLQFLAARVYPESHCQFRARRSIDLIFCVRQLQEKCQEQSEPLFLAFIDLTMAFDLISRSGLLQLLKKIGCPPKLHSIIVSLYTNMLSTSSYNGSASDPSPVNSGVKQGCVLVPTFFGIFFSMLPTRAFKGNEDEVYLHTQSDGRLYNLARLRAKIKAKIVDRFQYLGFTISINLSLESEINSRIAKAAAVMSKLHKRVWDNNMTVNTKMPVYRACILSTLLYSSENHTPPRKSDGTAFICDV
ncbi:uncharacterized protein LOC130047230 [Ostrea edulis]|uniref:uncharacterized protein LOC130047230 n=1 Tax=Ostrea edulis TaxID=37623 RepID=UPI0024AEC8EF|nr:uncharacterized protein LOC130047230 [Ostrea edulis]